MWSTELWCGWENIIWADNKFLTKTEEFYVRNTLMGVPEKGDSRQVLRLPSLKHTNVYNLDNDLMWEYETDLTCSASDMRTFSPDVRM